MTQRKIQRANTDYNEGNWPSLERRVTKVFLEKVTFNIIK